MRLINIYTLCGASFVAGVLLGNVFPSIYQTEHRIIIMDDVNSNHGEATINWNKIEVEIEHGSEEDKREVMQRFIERFGGNYKFIEIKEKHLYSEDELNGARSNIPQPPKD